MLAPILPSTVVNPWTGGLLIMHRCTRSAAAFGAVLALALALPTALHAQHYVVTRDPQHPKVRYADSLVSLNDRCIVAGNKLNLKVRPVYVSGAPIGFC
jgi:hypothetical protein